MAHARGALEDLLRQFTSLAVLIAANGEKRLEVGQAQVAATTGARLLDLLRGRVELTIADQQRNQFEARVGGRRFRCNRLLQ
jgi:hypothetical protein